MQVIKIYNISCIVAFGPRATSPNVKDVPVERSRNGTIGAQRT